MTKGLGSLVCQAHGIHAASKALRHGSLSISAAFYVEGSKRPTSGLGALLKDPALTGQNVIAIKGAISGATVQYRLSARDMIGGRLGHSAARPLLAQDT